MLFKEDHLSRIFEWGLNDKIKGFPCIAVWVAFLEIMI